MGRLVNAASGMALATVLVTGCGGGPTLPPLAEEPDDTSAGGPVDGCRPPFGDDEPAPDPDGVDEHPAFAGEWDADIFARFLGEHTDVLANVWSDDATGELVVMFPGPEGREVFERLRQDAPDPERVVCMEATYTHEELHLLMNRVDERLMAAGGPLPVRSRIDMMRNRLVVEFETEDDITAAEGELGDIGDDVGVRLIVQE